MMSEQADHVVSERDLKGGETVADSKKEGSGQEGRKEKSRVKEKEIMTHLPLGHGGRRASFFRRCSLTFHSPKIMRTLFNQYS